MGREVALRMLSSAARMSMADSCAHGIEPRPPASATPIAIAAVPEPAIGARIIGTSIPKRSRIRRSVQVFMVLQLSHEVTNQFRNFVCGDIQREVTRVEDMDRRARKSRWYAL